MQSFRHFSRSRSSFKCIKFFSTTPVTDYTPVLPLEVPGFVRPDRIANVHIGTSNLTEELSNMEMIFEERGYRQKETVPILERILQFRRFPHGKPIYKQMLHLYDAMHQYDKVLMVFDQLNQHVRLKELETADIATVIYACFATKNYPKGFDLYSKVIAQFPLGDIEEQVFANAILLCLRPVRFRQAQEIYQTAMTALDEKSSPQDNEKEEEDANTRSSRVKVLMNYLRVCIAAQELDVIQDCLASLVQQNQLTGPMINELMRECNEHGLYGQVEKLFDLIDEYGYETSSTTYNHIIYAHNQQLQFSQALKVYEQMKDERIDPSVETFAALIGNKLPPSDAELSPVGVNTSFATASFISGAFAFMLSTLNVKSGYLPELYNGLSLPSTASAAVAGLTFAGLKTSSTAEAKLRSLLNRLTDDQQVSRLMYIWQEMKRTHVVPTPEICANVIEACLDKGRYEMATRAVFPLTTGAKLVDPKPLPLQVPTDATFTLMSTLCQTRNRPTAKNIFQETRHNQSWGQVLKVRTSANGLQYDLQYFPPLIQSLAMECALDDIKTEYLEAQEKSTSFIMPSLSIVNCKDSAKLLHALGKDNPSLESLLEASGIQVSPSKIHVSSQTLREWFQGNEK